MKVYRIQRIQRLPIKLEDAWRFFSTPHNLEQITPDFLCFRITSEVPDEIYSGLIITYRISAVAKIPMLWITEIKHVERCLQFVDEQRIGPFRFWHHLHRFRCVEDGVEMEDIVHYVMPCGWLGQCIHKLYIAGRLQRIFDFRRDHLHSLFK